MEHECRHEREFVQIQDDFKEIKDNTKGTVTFPIFWSVVILLVGIFGSIMTVNYNAIQDLQAKNNDMNVSSARIETQLSQIQMDILDIKLSLKEHDSPTKK